MKERIELLNLIDQLLTLEKIGNRLSWIDIERRSSAHGKAIRKLRRAYADAILPVTLSLAEHFDGGG